MSIDWQRFEKISLKKPTITITNKYIYFNTSVIESLKAKYIVVYVNQKTMQIALKKAKSNNKYKHSLKRRINTDTTRLFDKSIEGKYTGIYYKDEEVIVFDLKK